MFTVDAKELKAALKVAARVRARKSVHPLLETIWLNASEGTLTIRSSDGYCGFRRSLPALVDAPVKFQVNPGLEKVLPKTGRLVFSLQGGTLAVEEYVPPNKGKTAFPVQGVGEHILAGQREDLPDMDAVFASAKNGQVVEVNAEELMRALILCKSVLDDDEIMRVTFAFRQDGIFLTSQHPDKGNVEHQISDEVHPLCYTVTFNPNFVLNYLRGWTKAQRKKLTLQVRIPQPELFGDYSDFHGEWGFWAVPPLIVINEEYIIMPIYANTKTYRGSRGYTRWRSPFVWWNPDHDFDYYYNLYYSL